MWFSLSLSLLDHTDVWSDGAWMTPDCHRNIRPDAGILRDASCSADIKFGVIVISPNCLMKPEWTKPFLYDQNTSVRLVFGCEICKTSFWTLSYYWFLTPPAQVLGCPLCHWRRRPLRSSGVRSIIHREGSAPESQAALADVVSDSGGGEKASHFHRNARWWIRPCPRGSGTSEVTFSAELFPNRSQRKDWNPCQLCLFAESDKAEIQCEVSRTSLPFTIQTLSW